MADYRRPETPAPTGVECSDDCLGEGERYFGSSGSVAVIVCTCHPSEWHIGDCMSL